MVLTKGIMELELQLLLLNVLYMFYILCPSLIRLFFCWWAVIVNSVSLPPGIKQVQMQLYPRALLLTANTLIVPQQGVYVYVCVFKCELDFMYSVSEWMFVLESTSPILWGFAYQELEKDGEKEENYPSMMHTSGHLKRLYN